MKVHHELPAAAADDAQQTLHPLVVAIGFFDGFHLGHRSIVRELMRVRRWGERTAIVTFRDHRAAYLRPAVEWRSSIDAIAVSFSIETSYDQVQVAL